MKENEKGQALIEFILILPILILLILGMIDIGTIFIKKIELEDQVTDIIAVWEKEPYSIKTLEEYFEKENLTTNILENTTTSFLTIEVKNTISLTTPIKKNYEIKIKRVIPLE